MNDSRLLGPVRTILPETMKEIVKTRKVIEEPLRTATFRKEIVLDQFLVQWDKFRGGYVARVIKLIAQPKPGLTPYGLVVIQDLEPQREDYLRRMVRAQLGITCVGGFNNLEPRDIPFLASAA